MKKLSSTGLKIDEHGRIHVLDQQRLPTEEIWLESKNISDMVQIIKTLKVRGAPLIGVSAALSLAHYAEQGAKADLLFEAADQLKAARPTAVNLSYCVNRVVSRYKIENNVDALIREAELIFEEDATRSQKIAEHAAPYIRTDMRILTHCNTGGLVTTGIGTALGAIIFAHQEGKRPFVYACETRPLLQGGRLTAWECVKNNIPHEILCDNAAANLMSSGKIDAVFVGADRIAKNGDSANKIGTYGLALLAHHFNLPFYILAPYTTFDGDCDTGADIIIEYRDPNEVKGACGMTWSPRRSGAYNPAFDVTPANLITAIILDNGIYNPHYTTNRNYSVQLIRR